VELYLLTLILILYLEAIHVRTGGPKWKLFHMLQLFNYSRYGDVVSPKYSGDFED